LARWRNLLYQLLDIHGVNVGRESEIHTAEPLLPEPNAFEVEMVIEKLKSYKTPGTDQIPAELIKAVRSTKLLFLFGIRRNCLRR